VSKTLRKKKKKSNKSGKITPVVGIIVPAIVGIIGIIVAFILNTKPVFYIESPDHLRLNQGITIIAGNWKADQDEDLYVIFDGFRFARPCKPIEKVNDSNQTWKFYLKEYTANPDLLKPGKHSICFAFEGEEASKEQNIYFIAEKKVIPPKPKKRKSNSAPVVLILLVVIILAIFIAIYVAKNVRKPEVKPKTIGNKKGQIKTPHIPHPSSQLKKDDHKKAQTNKQKKTPSIRRPR
jgi:flagellar basal body-associated protein FliL